MATSHRLNGDGRERHPGQLRAWETEPAFLELHDGRYRVDFDWLHARLGEIARALGAPRTGYGLGPHLLRARRALAEEAARRIRDEGREPPEVRPLADEKRSAAGVVNHIAWRDGEPTAQTVEELWWLARDARLPDADRLEWLRRGGQVPWDQPPTLVRAGDKYDYMGAALAEAMRRGQVSDEEYRRIFAMADLLSGDGAEERARAQRRDRDQPGRRVANGGEAPD